MLKKILIIFVLVAGFMACKKEDSVKVFGTSSGTASLEQLFEKFSPQVQNFSFKNETGATIKGRSGTWITFEPYTYGAGSGTVNIKLTEVYTVKEMFGSGIYTAAEGDQMLESKGMFEVKASMNGMSIDPVKASTISMAMGSGIDSSLKVFGLQDKTDTFKLLKLIDSNTFKDTFILQKKKEWKESGDPWQVDPNNPDRCIFKFTLLTWCNLDAYLERLSVDCKKILHLKDSFGGVNTRAFLHLDVKNGLVELYPNWYSQTYDTYSIRAGYTGKIFVVACRKGQYYLYVKDIVFTGSPEHIQVDDLLPSTNKDIEDLLNQF